MTTEQEQTMSQPALTRDEVQEKLVALERLIFEQLQEFELRNGWPVVSLSLQRVNVTRLGDGVERFSSVGVSCAVSTD